MSHSVSQIVSNKACPLASYSWREREFRFSLCNS